MEETYNFIDVPLFPTTLSSGVKRLQIRSKSDLKLADAMKLLLKAVS